MSDYDSWKTASSEDYFAEQYKNDEICEECQSPTMDEGEMVNGMYLCEECSIIEKLEIDDSELNNER